MTRGAYLEFCASLPGAVLDRPFEADFDSVVVRHGDTRKWFALVTCRQEQTWINLKCDPMDAILLRQTYQGVIPAWHMNKEHWNTVILSSDVPDWALEQMTRASFDLTQPRKKTARRVPHG
jgi:predicted DNA-binding protein (MmcQ/YjbR family)